MQIEAGISDTQFPKFILLLNIYKIEKETFLFSVIQVEVLMKILAINWGGSNW